MSLKINQWRLRFVSADIDSPSPTVVVMTVAIHDDDDSAETQCENAIMCMKNEFQSNIDLFRRIVDMGALNGLVKGIKTFADFDDYARSMITVDPIVIGQVYVHPKQ